LLPDNRLRLPGFFVGRVKIGALANRSPSSDSRPGRWPALHGPRGHRERGNRTHHEQLLGGDDQQPKGQVRRHLRRASHTDMTPAVIVVQVGIDPLGTAALAIA